jgi:L-alanine-DL-glutamate epimerase-like enolase superfamily enzyme
VQESDFMKIVDVRARWLRCPIPEPGQHTSDFGRLRTFDMALVEVETEDGLIGLGEAKAAVGSAGICGPLVSVVRDELRPLLIGEDSRNIQALWEKMYSGVRAGYAFRYGRPFPELGRRGLRISAISGVDMALWDILGKRLQAPVYRLLGGRVREQIPAYASGGWAPASEIGAQLKSMAAAGGFRAVKMRVGVMDGDVANSIARVRSARQGLGPEFQLMVDAHGTWDVPSARRFCRGVADCNLAWLEEPVNADDPGGMAQVRSSTDIPIAAGESLSTRFEFRTHIESRAVDILQPDPAIAGGITEVVRIAALGAAFQLTLAPHLWGSGILFAAGLHLSTALPNCVTVEYSMGYNPLLRGLVKEKFSFESGFVRAPEGAGLGVSVDPDFIRENTFEGE